MGRIACKQNLIPPQVPTQGIANPSRSPSPSTQCIRQRSSSRKQAKRLHTAPPLGRLHSILIFLHPLHYCPRRSASWSEIFSIFIQHQLTLFRKRIQPNWPRRVSSLEAEHSLGQDLSVRTLAQPA